MKKATIYKPT